jgi:topoisomerase-4 subunit A
MKDGSLKVSKVADKLFMGRDIIHVGLWPKDGDTNFYTMVYFDAATEKSFAKRFQIGGLSREKLYSLVQSEGSEVLYLHVAKTEEAMPKKLKVLLDGRSGARVREVDMDMTQIPVSARTAKGVTVTKWKIKDVKNVK